jgi:iron complex outermembrane receptor protein
MFRVGLLLRRMILGPLVLVLPAMVLAQGKEADLSTVSLENLLSIQVSSVSRHDEQLRSTAAAVYVITQDEIRRSGVTDIVDLFRMVPGMDVAQLTANTWAVSARGFNTQYATKMLVLVDGRTVYDPVFSGVYWHLQNLVLEDIDKIEVIRGPGATMWGANAVNGVISITTKRAADTQGGLLVADSGTNRPAEGSFRYGTAIGSNALFRLYGRQTARTSLRNPSGGKGDDSWNLTTGGLRLDWSASRSDSFTFESELYRGVRGVPGTSLVSLSPLTYAPRGLEANTGGFFLSRWKHTFRDGSSLTLQAYYDQRHLDSYYFQHSDTVDFDLQHNFSLGSRNNMIWGFGYRRYSDLFKNSLTFGVNPPSMNSKLLSAFVQNEVKIVPEKLNLTIGSKFEHSDFTGVNVQPSIKLAWTPTVRHSGWLSVARAVHTASRIERGMYLNSGAFPAGFTVGLVSLYGHQDTRNEGLRAYEAGYRYQANRKLWLDFSSFYNVYDHLSTIEPGETFFTLDPPPPHLVVPLYFGNRGKGETYGVEFAASYKPSALVTFRGAYTFLRMALHGYNGQTISTEGVEGQNPQNQFYIGSFLNLPESIEVASHTYFVSSLPSYKVPSYVRQDLSASWKRFENVEFSVGGQNLLGSHMESGDLPGPENRINRTVYGRVTWRF